MATTATILLSERIASAKRAEVGKNPAIRVLNNAAAASHVTTNRVSLKNIPPKAMAAIKTWASNANTPMSAVEQTGHSIAFGHNTYYCFAFNYNGPEVYTGTLRVGGDGTFVGEDSFVSS